MSPKRITRASLLLLILLFTLWLGQKIFRGKTALEMAKENANAIHAATMPMATETDSASHQPVDSIQMEDYSHGFPEHPPRWIFDPKEVAAEYTGIVETRKRLNEAMIPSADFRDVSLQSIFDFLHGKTGVWVLAYRLELPDLPTAEGIPIEDQMTFHLENVPASEVLRYASMLSGYADMTYANGVVAAKTICCGIKMGMSAEFKAPAEFNGMPITDYLISRGVEAFAWSKLEYDAAKGILRAFHNDENLRRIAIILEGLRENPPNIRTDQEIADSLEAWENLEWKRNLELQIAVSVEICDAPLEKVVEELRQKVTPWVVARAEPKARVNLSLKNVPIPKLLQAIADQTGTRLVMGLRFIALVPETQPAP